MKVKFDNNSVSGVNRKYRGFDLNIPGHSSIIVDVPPQYAKDAMSYLKHRHPAVVCTPIIPEKPTEVADTTTVASSHVKAELDELADAAMMEPEAELAVPDTGAAEEETAAPQEKEAAAVQEAPKRKAVVKVSTRDKKPKKNGGKK